MARAPFYSRIPLAPIELLISPRNRAKSFCDNSTRTYCTFQPPSTNNFFFFFFHLLFVTRQSQLAISKPDINVYTAEAFRELESLPSGFRWLGSIARSFGPSFSSSFFTARIIESLYIFRQSFFRAFLPLRLEGEEERTVLSCKPVRGARDSDSF